MSGAKFTDEFKRDAVAQVEDIIELTKEFGRYGYRMIAGMLNNSSWHVNRKRVERIWRQEGLKMSDVSALLSRSALRSRKLLEASSCEKFPCENNYVVCDREPVPHQRKPRLICRRLIEVFYTVRWQLLNQLTHSRASISTKPRHAQEHPMIKKQEAGLLMNP